MRDKQKIDPNNTKRSKKPKKGKPNPNNDKNNKKISFIGAFTEEEFRNTIVIQFNGMQDMNKLVKTGKAYCTRKLIPKLTEAIKSKTSLKYENFI